MGYLEKDESESECRAIQGTRQPRQRTSESTYICHYLSRGGLPRAGLRARSISSVRSILQRNRNPELCHGGTMTTALKQENESH